MKINFIYKNEFLPSKEKKRQIKEAVNFILKTEGKELSNLNIIFCSDEFIRYYNKEYLNHDYETDIITFHDKNYGGMIEGELLISSETVKTNSLRFKESFDDELMRVIIHGLLHLFGYTDKKRMEKTLIKKRENFYLKKIKENAGKNH